VLLWVCVPLALLLAFTAPLGLSPMRLWGDAPATLKFAADGTTVTGMVVDGKGRISWEGGQPLVNVNAAQRTITVADKRGVETTHRVDPHAQLLLDGNPVSLEKMPVGAWGHEFRENQTATVMRSVTVVAIVVAALFVLAALLAMRRPTTRSVMWLRHLIIAGFVLLGMYMFGGVRIVNLVWEKKLVIQLPAESKEPEKAGAPAGPAPTTPAVASPATAPVKPSPAARPPVKSVPTGPTAPGPSMRTEGIDLDAPPPKPAPVEPKVPATKPAPAAPELSAIPPTPAVAKTPATQPTPAQVASTTQPTTQAAGADALAAPPDSSVYDNEPPIVGNQYALYFRPVWNRIGAIAVAIFAIIVVIVHFAAWDLARQIPLAESAARGGVGQQDKDYHSNIDTSIVVHVLVILILPLLLMLHLPNADANQPLDNSTPGGGGGGEPIPVKIVKKKPQKKIPKYVLNKNAAISFYVPKMDDSRVVEVVDTSTQNQYTATSGTTGSGGGKGRGKGKGKGSGYGNGTGKVRFYHLQYSGSNTQWEDGFADGKDASLLHEWEARERKEGSDLPFGGVVLYSPAQLRPDPKGLIAPFIFVTGNANAMTNHEVDQVRQYILKGGMVFADPQYSYQGSCIAWAHRLFPSELLIPIDNRQDPIFDSRYTFGGPPTFWSGNRSFLGIKHGDRWVLVCDRGRMADGWKSPINEDCVRMGINVIDYAHDHYANRPN
jgi:outer membrane biosynthesis protein TonB